MGGSWDGNENKIIPDVYQRYTSNAGLSLTIGSRGTVAIAKALSWGAVGTVQTIDPSENMKQYTGYDITDEHNIFLREMLKGTNRSSAPTKIYLYRLPVTDAVAATATVETLTATAKYTGARGNDISIVITEASDNEGTFTVYTVLDGSIVDQQTASTVDELISNDWVSFTGTGALAATAGAALSGGTDGTYTAAAYSDFLTAIEPYQFDVLAYDGTDTTVKTAMQAFIKRYFDDDGQQAQLVAANLVKPDSRFIVNVTSGVELSDGTKLDAEQVVWWAAGALAAAKYNQGLTGATYPEATSVTTKLSKSALKGAIQNGEFVLTENTDGTVAIAYDQNSLVTYAQDITEPYHLNRTMRVVCTSGNDINAQFSKYYKGAENNNTQGRLNIKSAVVEYLLAMQANNGIQNFSADDVDAYAGQKKNAVRVDAKLDVVGSTDFIYVTWNVN